eukprot:gnl/MRDRNA2_/MRDRNA2_99879_c0_seq1.p1 gnl/MRDRNA2_/MRDRNA2_99879_c0~~gnl/MRDRNA2_/MRDRNA2_99879_c0_seq1.p1  ORF type:complete len:505 (-),score=99.57 gnl/MRDRNA2_/MRDRNA2_99879_c0_seq1:55-1467(-)
MTEKFAASSRLPNEWQNSTMANLQAAMRAQKIADEQFEQSRKSHEQTRQTNIDQYQNVHSHFESKVEATSSLKALLQERLESVQNSITASKMSMAALQTANQAKLPPLQLCSWRQEQRAGRPERELIRDPVEIALEEEKDVLMDARDKLQENAAKTEIMIKNLLKMHDDLSKDHLNKDHSLTIDKKCLGSMHRSWPTSGRAIEAPPAQALLNRSPRPMLGSTMGMKTMGSPTSLSFSGGLTLPHPAPSLGLEVTGGTDHQAAAWNQQQEENRQNDTLKLVQKAKDLERAAQSLREESDSLMQKTDADSAYARNQVEMCLSKRIDETHDLKSTLEGCIATTDQSIASMMHVNSMTGDNLQSHEEPSALYSTRIGMREKRMPRENIGDPVKTALDKHAESLKMNHTHLQSCHNAESGTLHELQRTKAICMADLKDKTTALAIDVKCKSQTMFDHKLTFEAANPKLTKYGRGF